jgi:streptomycin 6-kinase
VIDFPEDMRRTAEARGDAGRAWLEMLPDTVAALCTDWQLTPVAALDGGKAALVLSVRTASGSAAVLKVDPPRTGFAEQVRTIDAAAGHGYVRLYAYDPARNAALLEALGPTLWAQTSVAEAVLDISAATLREAWRVPRPATIPLGADKASSLLESLYDTLPAGHGECSDTVIEMAAAYARSRRAAVDLATCVICHGDPHPGNLLRVPESRSGAPAGYVFVDPDGFLCEPAYDLGVVIRAWTGNVMAAADPVALIRGYADRLATATGVDAQAIWEWGFLERVSSGLYLIRSGHGAEGRQFLESAERLVG